MIDITFDCNTLEIEGKEYNHLGARDCLKEALLDLLDKACYSGETITVWEAEEFDGKTKKFVKEFHSSNQNMSLRNEL